MIFLENGGAECLKSLSLLDAAQKLLLNGVAGAFLLLSLLIDNIVRLHGLCNRTFHHLVDLLCQSVKSLLVLAKTRATIEKVVPFVDLLAYWFLALFQLLFFEFVFKFLTLVRKVDGLVKCILIVLEALQDPLVYLLLLVCVLGCPLHRSLLLVFFVGS